MTALLFFLWLIVLVCEGWFLVAMLIPGADRTLRIMLALPLAAIANVLIIFFYTIIHVPLALITLGAAHIAIIAIAFILARKFGTVSPSASESSTESWSLKKKILGVVCGLLLANAFVFSAVHAVILPSLSIDVFTNWTMRAKVSWADGAMAFDHTEVRGVGKPQYPFLVHGLQVVVNEGQSDWSDRAANTITWLLTISSFGAAFVLLRKMRGTFMALCALSAMILLPMMTIHLSAGYGDIHVVTYALLAFVGLAMFLETRENDALLSSVMVLGAVWSKSEGLYFVFVPWAFALAMVYLKSPHPRRGALVKSMMIPLIFFIPFLAMILIKGLPLTPHESDGTFGIKPEGFAALPHALFGSGSLGPIWFILPLPIILLLKKSSWEKLSLFSFALLSLLGVLFIYLFTPNVGFLLNGQSFYRQMLLPAALLIVWISLALPKTEAPEMVESEQ